MKGVLRWLASNASLILFSLALAVLLWAVAVEQSDPSSERTFASAVPIAVNGIPDGMIVFDQSATQVYVTLRAPDSVWRNLRLDEMRATIDLSGLDEGTHQLPVRVTVNRRPVMVRRVEPATVTVQLETMAEAVVPVNVQITGNTATGYIAQPATFSPLTATVRGPASLVARVVRATAQVSVAGARSAVDDSFVLEPRDARGEMVPVVTLDPPQASVVVPVAKLGTFQDLVVRTELEGNVAPGYRISTVTVEPPVVTVFGRQDIVSQLPGYLDTEPLNIEGATESTEVELELLVPEGVSLLGLERPVVVVRVVVVPVEGSITVRRQVEIQGLSPGITATVAPTMVEVILSGPLPLLESLGESDVRVIVDLFELGPGSYSLAPMVVQPPGVSAESVLPANVQVVVAALTEED
jgi:YbbR domain-containing protein